MQLGRPEGNLLRRARSAELLMPPTLHLITASPHASHALRDCLQLADPCDTIVLMDDGAYTLTLEPLAELSNRTFCLAADAQIRGLTAPPGIALIDTATWVALAVDCPRCITWGY